MTRGIQVLWGLIHAGPERVLQMTCHMTTTHGHCCSGTQHLESEPQKMLEQVELAGQDATCPQGGVFEGSCPSFCPFLFGARIAGGWHSTGSPSPPLHQEGTTWDHSIVPTAGEAPLQEPGRPVPSRPPAACCPSFATANKPLRLALWALGSQPVPRCPADIPSLGSFSRLRCRPRPTLSSPKARTHPCECSWVP